MKVTADRVRKGQLKMRGLAEEILRFSNACSTVRGIVAPGPTVEIEHIDSVINTFDNALVKIRTLDAEVYEASDPTGYVDLRSGLPEGNVVRALTAPRNNAVHHIDVIDPDLERAIGPLDDDRFIIFPKWKRRSDTPIEMFQIKGHDVVSYITSYDSRAAERLVLDTLLDAFSFFDQCDPGIADKDSEGHLVGFPLAPLPIAGYHRLSPDWPDHAEVDVRIRESARTVAPNGQSREITGVLETDAGPVFCGYTVIDAGSRLAFTEQADQVQRDVGFGYDYTAHVDGRAIDVRVQGAELVADATSLVDLDLPNWTGVASEPWSGWWELCTADASYYRQQRQAG